MKLPLQELRFANGLVLAAQSVPVRSWQYHVLKHPLGVARDARAMGEDPERWGELEPPVVEAGWRAALFREIAAIERGGKTCELPEVRGKKPTRLQLEAHACLNCPAGVVDACERVTSGERPVGPRYAGVIQEVVELIQSGVTVHRHDYFARLTSFARRPNELTGLSAMRVLELGNKRRARFLRHDGLVVDFDSPWRGAPATWRTAFRSPSAGTPLVQFFMDLSSGLASEALSETCVVARHWWERHAI